MHRRRIVMSCCTVVVILGLLGLIGWLSNWELLRSIMPGLATMKPATAVGLVLSGLTLFTEDARSGASPRGVRVASALVFLIGVTTTLEYGLGVETGLAGFWLADSTATAAHPYPLRMSEITAWGFVLAGAGLMASTFERYWSVKVGAGLLLGVIAGTALVGYAYDAQALYSVEPFTSIALNTAIGFAALAVGLVASEPVRGISALLGGDTIGGRTARVLLPVAVLMPVGLGWLRLEGVRRGLYPTEFGTGLFAVASVVIFGALILGYGYWLDRIDAERAAVEQQLFQSQKLEAVGRLAAGVAHDFNNLLTVVVNTAVLASDDLPADHPVQDDLAAINASGQRASGLVQQLLTFGSGRVTQPRPVEIGKVVLANEPILRRLVPAHVELVIELGEVAGTVYVDPAQLEQVLVNLVVNSCDAIEGRGRLSIETRAVELDEAYTEQHANALPGPHAMLVVTDDGVGMDAETLSRIFEPFFTTKQPGKGSGLGLATAYGIVRQSGGHIWVYSEVGHGTSFKIYFPLADVPSQDVAPESPVGHTPQTLGTILVVDDDTAVLQVVTSVLKRAGHTVLPASDPSDAVAVARSHTGRIDLVMSDMIMPGIGLEGLLAELATTRPGAALICMTGYSAPATRAAIAARGVRLLEKPFGPTALMRAVREVMADVQDGPDEGVAPTG